MSTDNPCDKEFKGLPCADVARHVCVKLATDSCSRDAIAIRVCVDGVLSSTETIYETDGVTPLTGYGPGNIVQCPQEVRFCTSAGTEGGGAGGGDATAANQVLQLAQETAIAASLASIETGIPAALGQGTMAQGLKVVLASDQSRINVDPLGKPTYAQKITTGGTSDLVTLNAATTRVSIYATKAAYFSLGTGALVATTTDFFIGDNERLDFNVTAGGKIAAIQDSAAGVVYITELS